MSDRIHIIIVLISFALVPKFSSAQDSLNMVRVGHWDPSGMVSYAGNTYNDIWGYTTPTGEEYAIIGNVDSILVVDITDCSNPTRVYGYDGGNTTIWRDIKTFGTYAYSVCDNCTEGLHIFDMSALPSGSVQHELTTTAFFDKAHNIYIDTATQKLYAVGTNTVDEGFVILDLSVSPEDPTLIAELELDDEIGWPSANFYIHDVYVRNDTAYASHGNQGYYIWDLTDLNNIEVLGDFDAGGYNHSSWTTQDGSYAYFAEEVPTGRPMHVIDLANLGDPILDIQSVGTFQHSLGTSGGSTPHNPFIVNDTLYISYYHDGLKAYDLSNPSSPVLVGYYDTYPNNGGTYSGYEGAWGTYPFFDSGCICVSDVEHGLNIIKNCDIQLYYEDSDGDGYGNVATEVEACIPPNGWVTDKSDCDDTNANVNPGAAEVCDGLDNNCDGNIDEGALLTFYRDLDSDGHGDINVTAMACTAPTGFVTDYTDCNDQDDNIHPGNTEICDGLDNNCDGNVDEGVLLTFYRDLDMDGYGDPLTTTTSCSSPAGYVIDNTDCDDQAASINLDATELCDGIDNNCNGIIDENCNVLDACDAINLYISTITQNEYHVKEEIDSDATITSSQNITYNAGIDIDLAANFEVAMGAEFLAQIEDCDDTMPVIVNEPLTAKAMINILAKAPDSLGRAYLLYDSNNNLIKHFKTNQLLLYLAEVDSTALYTLRYIGEK